MNEPRRTNAERFPNWLTIYDQYPYERMPWYSPILNAEVKEAIALYQIPAGTLLDIGTGPAVNAKELARLGFKVTGIDIAPGAISRAQAQNSEGVTFIQDDILNSKLSGVWDYALDRGCFMVQDPDHHHLYVKQVATFLRPQGLLLLKCLSDAEPGGENLGPHRMNQDLLERIFNAEFELLSAKACLFHGQPEHQAIFAVLRRRG